MPEWGKDGVDGEVGHRDWAVTGCILALSQLGACERGACGGLCQGRLMLEKRVRSIDPSGTGCITALDGCLNASAYSAADMSSSWVRNICW
jgi:hypothetical protein